MIPFTTDRFQSLGTARFGGQDRQRPNSTAEKRSESGLINNPAAFFVPCSGMPSASRLAAAIAALRARSAARLR
ncbi:hypothetical protein, partial [Teichococcus cervicalis]|uniref:hypothetical protein n=1 Tax=Teichococcus cervicalis TaxID=204525 RepID=UPI001B7F9EEA